VPKPPPLRLERGERALHLVLRTSADATTASEGEPVASVDAQPDGHDEEQPGDRRRSRGRDRDREPEQRQDGATKSRLASADTTAILLAASVVGHGTTKVWHHAAIFPLS